MLIRLTHRLFSAAISPLHTFTIDGRFSVPFTPGQTILAAAEAAGVPIPADCKEGKCGKCEVDVRASQTSTSTDETAVEKFRLRACVEAAIDGIQVSRIIPDSGNAGPTYFQEKPFTRKQKEEERARRAAVKAERAKSMDTLDAMKERARKFEEVSGVSLKDDGDDEDEDPATGAIDWNSEIVISEHEQVARRCMLKLRSTDPSDLNIGKFKKLVKANSGVLKIKPGQEATDAEWEKALESWKTKHQEELDKVTFDNCANYEP